MPPEVIFILILIVFSILESAFRGKRRSEGDFPAGGGLPPGWPGQDESGTTGRVERGGEGAAVEGEPQRPRETADQMVPDDIWEDIAALARGDVEETLRRRRQRGRAGGGAGGHLEQGGRQGPPRRSERPPRRVQGRPTPPVPRPTERSDQLSPSPHVGPPPETRRIETRQPPPVPTPAAEASGEQLGPVTEEVRPVLRERMEQLARAEKKQRLEADKARVPARTRPATPVAEREIVGPGHPSRADRLHSWFRGAHALRHAVIAREVLGRPLALRDHGDEELWSQ